MSACSPPPRSRAAGMTLVELMVGMVVALLVGLVAIGLAASFASGQRQATAVSASLSNGATALDVLKSDALLAGLGFFGDSSYRCSMLNLSIGSTAPWDGTSFSPLQVTRPATGLFDSIELVHATSVYGGAGVPIKTSSQTRAMLASHLPGAVGQAVLLSPANRALPCTVRTITGVAAGTAGTFEELEFEPGIDSRHNQVAFSNPATYAPGDSAALLDTLVVHRYRVTQGRLEQLDRANGDSVATLARDVVAFRAQYGVSDAAGTQALGEWVDPLGRWAALDSSTLPRVLALRLQLLTRAPQREKPDAATGLCTATPSPPQLLTGETFPLSEEDKCYRYRLISTVVPVRNFIASLP